MLSEEKDKVFKSKVLKRLYGSESEEEPKNEQSSEIIEHVKSKETVQHNIFRKVYSVSRPPAGVQLEAAAEFLPADSNSSGTDQSSGGETKGFKRRRKRRRKKETNAECLEDNQSRTHNEVTASTQKYVSENKVTSSGLTKNQRRKLKKKRQNERKKTEKNSEGSKEFTVSTSVTLHNDLEQEVQNSS